MAQGYVYEIKIIDDEIKRETMRLKQLRAQREVLMSNLHSRMTSMGIDKVGEGKNTITLQKCAPKKPRAKGIPKKQKRESAVALFRETGIPNPEGFYDRFENTQKIKKIENKDKF